MKGLQFEPLFAICFEIFVYYWTVEVPFRWWDESKEVAANPNPLTSGIFISLVKYLWGGTSSIV